MTWVPLSWEKAIFFKKKPAPPTTPAKPWYKTFDWPKPNQRNQNVWVQVSQWDYKVFPTLKARLGYADNFQFTGHISNEPMAGIAVAGDVEFVDDVRDFPMFLVDFWPSIQKLPGGTVAHPEGHGSFMEQAADWVPPALGLTLYAARAAEGAVHRAFANGLQPVSSGLGIDVWMDSPEENPDFWSTDWKGKDGRFRVTSWKLFSGSFKTQKEQP